MKGRIKMLKLIRTSGEEFIKSYDFKYYPLYGRVSYFRTKSEPHPENIKEILIALNKMNFQLAYETTWCEYSVKDELDKMVPGLVEFLFNNNESEFRETVIVIFDQSFAIEFEAYEEFPLYGERTAFLKINGIIVKKDVKLSDIEKHFDKLKQLKKINW
jgi:hypothetical protein